MAAITSLNFSTPKSLVRIADYSTTQVKLVGISCNFNQPPMKRWQLGPGRLEIIRPVKAVPEGLSEKVEKSIQDAKQTCADDPVSGECVAAWDEVEELSAAASHAKDRNKGSDPLEEYCKDNPETDECRTYED